MNDDLYKFSFFSSKFHRLTRTVLSESGSGHFSIQALDLAKYSSGSGTLL